MQNLNLRQYANTVALLVPDTQLRRVLVPAILGIAIGSLIKQPVTDDLNATTAFNSMHLANVARAVSVINEEVLVDVEATIASAKAIFLVRNRILHGQACAFSAMPEIDFMSVVLGFSTVVPLEVYQAIVAAGLSSVKLYQSSLVLVGELKKTSAIEL